MHPNKNISFYKQKHNCKDCNKIIAWQTVKYGNGRCNICRGKIDRKPINRCIECKQEISKLPTLKCSVCGNIKHGRYSKRYHTYCLACGKEICSGSIRCGSCSQMGHCVSKTTRQNMSKAQKIRLKDPKNHPSYIGNLDRKYPLEFRKIKKIIRKRDEFICQNPRCKIKQKENIKKYNRKLDVHHIDYNKINCKEENLITLCLKCNCKVNFNRDYWFAYFTYIIEERKYGYQQSF